MKKIMFIVGFCTLAVAIGRIFSSCMQAKAVAPLDVVHGTKPMDAPGMDSRSSFIASLKPLSPAERKKRIDKEYPRLCGQLFRNLHAVGLTCQATSVGFVFGSGKADSVSSGDGLRHSGIFTDELFAVVKGPCFKDKDSDSLCVFVACFNGTFYLNGKLLENVGSYTPVFTIEQNYGLNHYVDYHTAIWLAQKFHLPIFVGHGKNKKPITAEKAYTLEGQLGEKFVNADVYPGDVIDLGNMTYTHGSEVRHAVP